MELRAYQREALKRTRDFLSAARLGTVEDAFRDHQTPRSGRRPRPYVPVAGLTELPYVCVKLPTGGGKTLLAAATVPVAAEALDTPAPVVLWFCHTNTILSQTLRALRSARSPYREFLGRGLPTPTVLSMAEALQTGRAPYDGGPVIIVSTFPAVNADKTEGRKVYASNSAALELLEGLPRDAWEGMEMLEGADRPVYSLANALRARRPVVILDEAHKMRTATAFATLARFAPSVILEYTATPEEGTKDKVPSNVLVDVTAFELRIEGMIKAPIEVRTVPQWQNTLAEGLAKRVALEPELLPLGYRPVVLVQCEPKDGEVTYEAVLEHLLAHGHDRSTIALATGSHDELTPKVGYPESPVEIVLTVDKLREGWDCPSAYVLVALRDLSGNTPVVQTLGRIMRQPGARKFEVEALDRGYAYVRGDKFATAAEAGEAIMGLLQRKMGYDRWSAQTTVELPEQLPLDSLGGLFGTGGGSSVGADWEIAVPVLTTDLFGEREPVTRDHLFAAMTLDLGPYGLPEYDPTVESAGIGIDFNASGLMRMPLREAARQLALILDEKEPTEIGLVRWLDRTFPHPEVGLAQSVTWLREVVSEQLRSGRTVKELWSDRFRLRLAVEERFKTRAAACMVIAAQGFLFDPPDEGLRADETFVHEFPRHYMVPRICEDAAHLDKHVPVPIGEMNGEEMKLAEFLNEREGLECWIRNVERLPGSFSLPTSTDKFYPDFVAKRTDGVIVVIEHKGEDRSTTDDSKEKATIGEVWASRSDGRCLFVMSTKADYKEKVRDALRV